MAPGPWTLVHVAGLVVLLADAAPGSIVDACRSAAGSGDLDDVLDAALAAGVRSVPDLAAVALGEAGARVVVRGGARVVVDVADGAQQVVEAAGARPWHDVDLPDAVTVTVLAPGQDVASARPLEAPGGGPDRAAAAPVAAAWPLPPSLTVPAVESPVDAAVEAPTEASSQEPADALAPATPDDAPAFSYDFLFGATERGLALGGVPPAAAPAVPPALEPTAPGTAAPAPPAPPEPAPGHPLDGPAVDLTLPPPAAELTDLQPPAPG
ncbi:MAG: hypothetical protein ACTHN8_08065, partial [Angustibacter sp.]